MWNQTQFSRLSPKLIKSWSHLFCFEKCQGFMLEVPPSLLTISSCWGTSVWKTTHQQAQQCRGLAEIKPQAPGGPPHSPCRRGAELGQSPPCPPGSPFTPAKPLVHPTIRQGRGQRPVPGKDQHTALDMASSQLLFNLTKFIYHITNLIWGKIQGRGRTKRRHSLGFHPSSNWATWDHLASASPDVCFAFQTGRLWTKTENQVDV